MRIRIATRKGLFIAERKGKGSWRVAGVDFLGDMVTLSLLDPRNGAVYACLRHGHFGAKLHMKARGASAWEEIACPAFPEGAAPVSDKDEGEGPSVDTLWALEAGGKDMQGELWCGTIPGGLFRSTDGGRSWSLVQTLWNHPLRKGWTGGGAEAPGIHSICVDPRDPRRLLLGVSTGGAWLTTDRGQTWDVRGKGIRADYMPPELAYEPKHQDVHQIVQCPSAPDCYWTQHHNGIWRSTDGGETWQEVKSQPSSFGFGVVVHPKDPERAWFVPAIKDEKRIPVDGKLVVSRTKDGGKTFEVLREGLPQEHAYDLVLRHALARDASGDVLAFGSTTGSVFVTEDQGDRWSLVSAHLPPIYSVRIDEE